MRFFVGALFLFFATFSVSSATAKTVLIEATGVLTNNPYVGDRYDSTTGLNQRPLSDFSAHDPMFDQSVMATTVRGTRGSMRITERRHSTVSLQAHGAPTYLEVSDCSGFFSLACGVSEVTTTILNHTPNGLEFAYGHNLSDPYAGFNFWMPYYVHGTLLPNRFTIAVDAPENWYVGASSVVSWAVAPTFDLTSFSVRTVSPAIAAAPVPLPIAFLLTGLGALALLRRRRLTVSS
jgi:hypothetical protein